MEWIKVELIICVLIIWFLPCFFWKPTPCFLVQLVRGESRRCPNVLEKAFQANVVATINDVFVLSLFLSFFLSFLLIYSQELLICWSRGKMPIACIVVMVLNCYFMVLKILIKPVALPRGDANIGPASVQLLWCCWEVTSLEDGGGINIQQKLSLDATFLWWELVP